MTIKFLIEGNPFDKDGNPIPYTRTTQKAKYTSARYARYKQWISWVQGAFLQQNPDHTGLGKYSLMMFRHRKPILLAEGISAKVDILIKWKDKKGGDGDNVYKGILDALFINDKWVRGSYDWALSEDKKGLVEVQIEFLHNNEPIADNLMLDVQKMTLLKSNDITREIANKKFKVLSPKKNEPRTKAQSAKKPQLKKNKGNN